MFLSLAQIISLLEYYGYALFFPIAVIEGPIVTILASFIASLGYLNVFIVYAISIAGDIVGDCIYYAIGRYGGRKFFDRWGKYVGVTEKDVAKLEKHFKKHTRKTLIIAKFTHGIGAVFLMAAGAARVPIGEFVLFNFLPTLVKSLGAVLIGFYFGRAYASIAHYLDIYVLISLCILATGFIIYKIYTSVKE